MAYKRFGLGPPRRVLKLQGGRNGTTRARLRNRFKQSLGRTLTSSLSKRTRDVAPITGESDWRSTYRRKRMPYPRRRRWVKFVRRTQAVIDKSLASSFFIRLRRQRVVTVADKQGVSSVHTIFGNVGISSPLGAGDLNDLLALTDRVREFTTTQSTLGLNYSTDKFRITGYLAETQIHNVGNDTAYVDMYYWRCKRDVSSSNFMGQAGVDYAQAWSAALARMQANIPPSGSALDRTDYGITPFNVNGLASYLQIYKKTRVKLSPGGITQIEQRGARNVYYNYEKNLMNGHIQGMTHGIFFIIYGAPTIAFPTAAPVDLMFSTNVNYTVRAMMSTAQTGGTTQA